MEPTQTPDAAPAKKGLLSRLTPKQRDFLAGRYAVSNSATVLVLVIYALLLLSRFYRKDSEAAAAEAAETPAGRA